MATIRSAQDGLWSDTATWTGGVVPGPGDIAEIAHDINVDQSVTVEAFQTYNTYDSVSSRLRVTTDGLTMTATAATRGHLNWVSIGALWEIELGVGESVDLVGDFLAYSSAKSAVYTTPANAGTVNIIGSTENGSAHATCGRHTGGIMTFTGTAEDRVYSNAYAFKVENDAILEVTGDLVMTGGEQIYADVGASGRITVIGDQIHASNYFIEAVNPAGLLVEVFGAITCKDTVYPFIYTAAETGLEVVVSGPINSMDGAFFSNAAKTKFTNDAATYIEAHNPPDQLHRFYSASYAQTVPAEADVRSGTTFGAGGALAGSCAIPPASSVRAGVPVDDTVGTGALTPQGVWDALTSALTASGSIGERLKTASTVETVGTQWAS